MVAIQMVSALIGRVTGKGLAANMAKVLPRPVVGLLVALLFAANTINVGADLAAMGEAANLVTGWNEHAFTIFFALELFSAATNPLRSCRILVESVSNCRTAWERRFDTRP